MLDDESDLERMAKADGSHGLKHLRVLGLIPFDRPLIWSCEKQPVAVIILSRQWLKPHGDDMLRKLDAGAIEQG